MADPTITTLNSGTQLVSVAKDDVIPSTDVSDTTEAAAGTSKPLEVGNLAKSILPWIACVDNEVVCVDNEVVFI